MKTFKVISSHDVYIDNYVNGEAEHVNFYMLESEIIADNYKEAIEKYFSGFLFYKFNFDNSQISECRNFLYYNVLVNVENLEASKIQIENWKNQSLTLYANNIKVECLELKRIKL